MLSFKQWLNENETAIVTVDNTNEQDFNVGNFFGELFRSRQVAHNQHLDDSKFAQHTALQLYYEGIIPLIDPLVESYQGLKGKVKITVNAVSTGEEQIVPYLEELYNTAKSSKDMFNDMPNIQNQIDTILDLISSTLYKLKELTENEKSY